MNDLFTGQEEQGSIDLTLKDGDRFVVVGDSQIPFHDETLLESIFNDFVPSWRPVRAKYHLFLAGDIIDNFSLSKFPPRVTPNFNLSKEIEITHAYLTKWRDSFDARHFIFGNHEDRWDRESYNGKFAQFIPPLHEVLDLKTLGYDYVPYLRHFTVNGFVLTHGDTVTVNTARSMLDTYCASGVSGHVNRPHDYTKADARDGVPNTWTVVGMTCRMDIGDYIKDWRRIQPWMQGFGIGEIHNGKVYFENIRVHHGAYRAAGNIYRI